MIARTQGGVAFVLDDGQHERCRPYLALDVHPDGRATTSPAFTSISALREWQSGHSPPWGCQRRTVSGKQARRWLAATTNSDPQTKGRP
jgi:hypothetical protein